MVKTVIGLNGIQIPPTFGRYKGKEEEFMAEVIFQVQDGQTFFVIPIIVDRREYEDADLVAHAERVLSQLLDDLSKMAKPLSTKPAPRNWLQEPFGSRADDEKNRQAALASLSA